MNYTTSVSDKNQDIMSQNVMACEKSIGEMRYLYTLASNLADLASVKLDTASNYETAMNEQFDLLYKEVDKYKENALSDEERAYADDFVAAAKNAQEFRLEKFSFYKQGINPTDEMMTKTDSNMKVMTAL